MITQAPAGKCICVEPETSLKKNLWTIYHGAVDHAGCTRAIHPILRLQEEEGVVNLAKAIGRRLGVPVYRMVPDTSPELIQHPSHAGGTRFMLLS